MKYNYIIDEPYIEVTSTCNMKCKYCYHGEIYEHSFIDLTILEKLMIEFKENGIKKVKISGGEPFLHPNIWEIIDIIYNSGIEMSIVSNGSIVNYEILINYIHKIESLNISLDSFDKNINSITRLPDFTDKVLSLIVKIINSGHANKIAVCSVITKYNYKYIEGYVKTAIDYGIKKIYFELVHREGNKSNYFFDELNLNYDEYLFVYNMVNSLRKKYKSIISISSIGGFFGGCKIIADPGVISPRIDYCGNVYICKSFISKDLSCGNIKDKKMFEIIYSEKVKNFIIKMKNRTNSIEKCKKCHMKNMFCLGGCFAKSINKVNTFYEVDDLCEFRKKYYIEKIKQVYGKNIKNFK